MSAQFGNKYVSIFVHNRGTSVVDLQVNMIAFAGYPGSKESEGFLILMFPAQKTVCLAFLKHLVECITESAGLHGTSFVKILS